MNQIPLSGCSVAPLDSYLKALGILRLLAEQAPEARARGFWRNDSFVLETEWTQEQILDFFLNQYAPTPVIAPWKGQRLLPQGPEERHRRRVQCQGPALCCDARHHSDRKGRAGAAWHQ
jgi:CRISPR-associated protein Csx17